MEVRDYLAFLRRRWWLLLLGPALACSVAYGVSQQITPVYRATAQLFVMNQASDQLSQLKELEVNERLTNTYVKLIERRPVLESVIESLDLTLSVEGLEGKISVASVDATQLITLSVEDHDPEQAAAIANATAAAFVADIDRQLGRSGTISIAERASPPPGPASPNLRTNLMLAAVLGLLMAGAVAVALEYLDDTIKSAENLEPFGMTTLGVISHFRHSRGKRNNSGSWQSWTPEVLEDFRQLRANIQFVNIDSKVKTIVVTSFGQGEGKSTVAAGLARVLAQAGERVLLVDADLRRPMLHGILGAPNSFGLTGLLLEDSNGWFSALKVTDDPNLLFLASGPLPPNPSELLASKRMSDLVERLKAVTDFVIFDTPPVAIISDASVLAHSADGVLVVVERGKTRTGNVTELRRALHTVGARVVGAVITKQRRSGRLFGHSHYASSYRTDREQPARKAPSKRGETTAIREITSSIRALLARTTHRTRS